MGARLQGHVHGRAPRRLACRLERDHLGVRPALPLVPPLADDLAVAHDDRADDRVRMRRAAPALGELERPLQHQEIAWARPPVGPGDVLLAEDARAGDEQVGAGFADLGRVVGADPAVHLHVDTVGQQLPQPLHAWNGLGHERLPRIPRVDAHAEDEVDELAGGGCDVVRLGLGVEGDADPELELARLLDHAREVVAGLVVHGHAVPARLRDLPRNASPGSRP